MNKNNLTRSFMFLFYSIFLFSSIGLSQNMSRRFGGNISISQGEPANSNAFKYIPKKQGHYSVEDWQVVIDSTWGQGDLTSIKLKDFDDFWKRIDEEYPSFHNLDVNWDSLRNVFRPEIEAGVSRGRFYAIMSQLFISLMDNHTRMVDKDVARTELKHGVPLLVTSGYWEVGHFGAALAPSPDSSLFVYRVVENHPLGLEVGDIILGYDDTAWKKLYKELLEIQFPIVAYVGNSYKELPYWASTKIGIEHTWLTSAGMNWHLFDTLDVVKYNTGDTVHLSVKPLEAQTMELVAAGQLPVAGIPFPQVQNDYNPFSWGIIDNTKIGYMYIYSVLEDYWTISPGGQFTNAIEAIMADENIEGVIIDSRLNEGGNLSFMNRLGMLFNEDWDLTQWDVRADPNDHFAMQWQKHVEFKFDDRNFFDKPIAVLTGPLSQSVGDMFPLILESHPLSRSFGLPTSGAFGGADYTEPGHWQEWVTVSNWRYKNQENVYFTHKVFPPDEMLWLELEDAVKGEDTVVKRAMQWIQNKIYPYNLQLSKTWYSAGSPVDFKIKIHNPEKNDVSLTAILINEIGSKVDSIVTVVKDSLLGLLTVTEEDNYYFSFKTISGLDTQYTPYFNKPFTTKGPVTIDHYEIVSTDSIPNPGDILKFKLFFKNNGLEATIHNIKIGLTQIDSCAVPLGFAKRTIDSLSAGEIKEPNSSFIIKIESDCTAPATVPVQVDIYQDENLYWIDTLYIDVVTGIADIKPDLPKHFALNQNYPNPFNPETVISYQLSEMSDVELNVYNLLGQKVVTLVNKEQEAGYYSVKFNSFNLASGIYVYKLKAGSFEQSCKMILLR
jgi:C-terminal processing protease CtpA/Prc